MNFAENGLHMLGLGRRLSGLMEGKNSRPPFDFSPYDVLNPQIRHALEYEGAELNRKHIADLVKEGRIDPGIYLTAKALDGEKEKQRSFIEKLLANTEQHPGKPLAHRDILNEALLGLNPSATVEGAKIAKLSRQGFDAWEERNRQIAKELTMKRQTPAMVAYASLLALRHLFEENGGNPFLILVPSWIENTNDPLCGYEIHKEPNETGERISFLSKDFYRSNDIVIFDDVVRTGKHLKMMQDFLSSGPNGKNNYPAIFAQYTAPFAA